jgi:hypothetical protein
MGEQVGCLRGLRNNGYLELRCRAGLDLGAIWKRNVDIGSGCTSGRRCGELVGAEEMTCTPSVNNGVNGNIRCRSGGGTK